MIHKGLKTSILILAAVAVSIIMTPVVLGLVEPAFSALALITLITSVAIAIWERGRKWVDEPLEDEFLDCTLILVGMSGAALQLISSAIALWLFPVAAGGLLGPLLDSAYVATVFTICLLMPVAEEAFFRGYLWERLSGWRARTLIITLAFAASHIFTWGPTVALLLLPASWYFTWLRKTTSGLVAPIVAHIVFNVVAVLC